MSAPRLAVLDVARGLAVVAMAIYHFSWDLSWFGYVDWPVAQGGGWRIFAACIAGSFLFLAGISLDLAHHDGLRLRAFLRRLAVIVLAAAAVSTVTYFVFGDSFVRFGILHCIAAASVLALPFTRAPLWAGTLGAAVLLSLPAWAASPAFDGQLLLWTGLGTPSTGSVDYVPLAPWAGLTLAGVTVSGALRRFGIWQRLAVFRLAVAPGRVAALLGRHSLAVYLLHQPLLYGLVWGFTLVGPDIDRTGNAFVRNCTQACEATLDAGLCKAACACTLARMKAENVWTPLNENPEDPSLRARMNDAYALCLADPDATAVN